MRDMARACATRRMDVCGDAAAGEMPRWNTHSKAVVQMCDT